MALVHTPRGAARRREASSGPATLCEKGPRDRRILAGNHAAKCFRRRGGAPRCTGSERMKHGKLGYPRATAPNGAGTQPAWRLPTPSFEFKSRCENGPRDRPSRRATRRSTLRRRGGAPPLRGVGLAAWPSRWVTGGLDLLRRLGNRRTWRHAAPNCEFRPGHPVRTIPLGQNQAGSQAFNYPPPAWRGAPSRGVEQMSELSLSRFRRCFYSNCDLAPEPPASAPLTSLGRR